MYSNTTKCVLENKGFSCLSTQAVIKVLFKKKKRNNRCYKKIEDTKSLVKKLTLKQFFFPEHCDEIDCKVLKKADQIKL